MKSNLIAYALDFTSYLIQKEKDKIRNIILFGSVAREEADKESDVDIFIDLIKEDSNLEKKIKNTLEDFMKSTKYVNYWKMLDVKNEITLSVGNLEKWKELKPSIIANGVLLYGKYKSEVKNGKHRTFFIWENIKPNSKRVLFNKQLFGYNQNNKFYPGLLQKYNGTRLGKGCISIPIEHSINLHRLFKKYKITVKLKKVLEYAS